MLLFCERSKLLPWHYYPGVEIQVFIACNIVTQTEKNNNENGLFLKIKVAPVEK